MRTALLIFGALGVLYTIYLLLFRRDWPERRKDDRRWRSDRREDDGTAAERETALKRREADRRGYERRNPGAD